MGGGVDGRTKLQYRSESVSLSQIPIETWLTTLIGYVSIDAFLPSATSFGFFLDQGRFRASALLTRPAASSNLYGSAYTVPPAGFSDDLNSATLLPLGHPARPTPALLFSVYLCGLRFTGDERMRKEWEGRVLRRALHEVGGASLASSELGLNGTLTEPTFATNTTPSNPNTHPLHLLHTIQADILLASYFLAEERYAEADRHVTSAVAIALLGGLHKIRSRSSPASFNTLVLGGTSPSSGASVSASGGLMPSFLLGNSFAGAPQATPEEIEREHVLAFWTALTLDRTVSLPRGVPCAFVTLADRPDRRVDVMWPVEIGAGNEVNVYPKLFGEECKLTHPQYSIPPSLRTERTIAKFLNHEPTSDGAHFSNASLIAKAALLWDRACELGGMWGIGTSTSLRLLTTRSHDVCESNQVRTLHLPFSPRSARHPLSSTSSRRAFRLPRSSSAVVPLKTLVGASSGRAWLILAPSACTKG